MDTIKKMSKTTTTSTEAFTLSNTYDANRSILNAIADDNSAENLTINRDHINNNESSNESIEHKSAIDSPYNAITSNDFDQFVTKNKRKNFQPRSSCNIINKSDKDDEDKTSSLTVESVRKQMKPTNETQQLIGQPNSTNAFNAVKELLNVYGLSMSPNDIVDALNKTIETRKAKEQMNSSK